METPTVASLLAIELPSVVSPPFAVETPTVASLLAIEFPSVVSLPLPWRLQLFQYSTATKKAFSELVSHNT